MTTEAEFDRIIATAPEEIRQDVYAMAWENAWSVECFEADKTDEERWRECILLAEMIIDAPSDFGI